MKILILWRSFICSLTFFQILPLHFHNIVNDIYNVLSSLEKNQEKMTEKWGSLFLPQGRTDVTAVTDQSRKDRGDTGEGPGPHLIFRPKWGQKKFFFGDQAPPHLNLRVWMTVPPYLKIWIHHWRKPYQETYTCREMYWLHGMGWNWKYQNCSSDIEHFVWTIINN